MITEKDLQEAIAECKGKRNPTADTCVKLAAYYTIQDHMNPGYSYSAEPVVQQSNDTVEHFSDSEFARAVAGKDAQKVWAVLDELMDALSVMNPKLYRITLDRLS